LSPQTIKTNGKKEFDFGEACVCRCVYGCKDRKKREKRRRRQ
jgi:hypothetical protein